MIIKVCGMREPSNIRAVEALGIDWMGFIFYPRSSRYVDTVPTYLPTRCKRVGVFVDADVADIVSHVRQFALQFVQLHGAESVAHCMALRRALPTDVRIIKMIAIGSTADLQLTEAYAPLADYFLFETPCTEYGGSGRQFDWSLLQHYDGSTPFILTGGIGPTDAQQLHRFHHPRWAGIDLNSRFETQPAIKNEELLKHFLQTL